MLPPDWEYALLPLTCAKQIPGIAVVISEMSRILFITSPFSRTVFLDYSRAFEEIGHAGDDYAAMQPIYWAIGMIKRPKGSLVRLRVSDTESSGPSLSASGLLPGFQLEGNRIE